MHTLCATEGLSARAASRGAAVAVKSRCRAAVAVRATSAQASWWPLGGGGNKFSTAKSDAVRALSRDRVPSIICSAAVVARRERALARTR